MTSPFVIPDSATNPIANGAYPRRVESNSAIQIYLSIKTNGGTAELLANPVATEITQTQNAVNEIITLTNANQSFGPNVSNDVVNVCLVFANTLTEFKTHTDLLSGVTQSTGNSATPDLEQALGVGIAISILDNTVYSTNTYAPMMNIVSSLFAGNTLNSYITILNSYIFLLNNNVAANSANTIETNVGIMSNTLLSGISSDQAYYADALTQLRYNALGQTLVGLYRDPGAAYIINNEVGTPLLLTLLSLPPLYTRPTLPKR